MKFKVATYDLSAALATVTRAIPARAARPILEGVLVTAGEGTVTLTATDGSMTIRTACAAYVDEAGEAVFPGRLLTDLVRRLSGAQTDVSAEGTSAKIRSDRNRTTMTVSDAKEYPDAGTFKAAHTVTLRAGTLRGMIGRVAFAVSTDENRAALTGIRAVAEGGRLELVALDGFRLAKAAEAAESDGDFSALIPGRTMTELARVLPEDGDAVMGFSGRNVMVSFGATTVSSVLLTAEFPDYRKILPSAFAIRATVSRSEALDAIERVGILAKSARNNLVRMTVGSDGIGLTSRDDSGEIAEQIRAETRGGDLDISFNAKYLTDVFRACGADAVTLSMNSAVQPAVITPDGSDGEAYLVLPVRTA